MSMIFRDRPAASTNQCGTACPACYKSAERLADVDIKCQSCFIWFRRVTVIEDILKQIASLDAHVKPTSRLGSGQNISTLVGNNIPSDSIEDYEDVEDVNDFKHVRIYSPANNPVQQRIDQQPNSAQFPSERGASQQEDADHRSEITPFYESYEYQPQDRSISAQSAEAILLGIFERLGEFDDLYDTAVVNRSFYRVFKRHEEDLVKTMWSSYHREYPSP